MARKYLKDEDGIPLITAENNRSRAFQVAETISLKLNIEAVITKAKDPETGGKGLGVYVAGKKGELSPDVIGKAVDLWQEFI